MHLFISDVHIRTDNSERSRRLIKFINEFKPRISDLYILGDLFEFWFEYNLVIPKHYFRTLAALYDLIQSGRRVHYILGNHEVMIGDFLKNFGFVVHPEKVKLEIDNRIVYLAHGNKIDRRIWTRMWQMLLTSKLNHTLYSVIHPDIGIFLAQVIAFISRKQKTKPNLVHVFEEYARAKLEEVDIVILAHTHIPDFKEFPDNKFYVNTGDWVKHFSYAVINNGKISLRYYDG